MVGWERVVGGCGGWRVMDGEGWVVVEVGG